MDRFLDYILKTLVALTLIYVTLPSVVVVITAFGDKALMMFPPDAWSTRWFVRAIQYEDFRLGIVNGLIITSWTTWIAVVIGTCSAFAIERFSFPGKSILEAILASPLVIPHFTMGVGFLILASGLSLSRSYGVAIACHVVLVLPFVMRSVYVSLKNIDPALERAAASLGARPMTVFLRINLPLLAPGVAGGALMAAILSFNEFTATLFVTGQNTQTLPVAMYTYIREYADPTMAALSAMMIAATTLFLIVVNRWLGLEKILAIDSSHHR